MTVSKQGRELSKSHDERPVNEVRLCGRLAAEPEERVLPSGDSLVTFRLVVARPASRRRGPAGRTRPLGGHDRLLGVECRAPAPVVDVDGRRPGQRRGRAPPTVLAFTSRGPQPLRRGGRAGEPSAPRPVSAGHLR